MSCPIKQSLYNIYICIEKYSYILYNYKLMGQLYFLNNRKSCYGSHKTQKLALPNSHVTALKDIFYTIPCAVIASATFSKPAMFAPTT